MSGSIEDRKRDHLSLCAGGRVGFREKTTLFEQVELVHRATTGGGLDRIDLGTRVGGRTLPTPLWIGAMTGGARGADAFNRELAGLAAELGLALCLGSMKPMLRDPARATDFMVREEAPGALILGNIGATEIASAGPAPILDAIARIGADGVGVHLNPLMELVQPGGDTDFAGVADGIAALVEAAGPGVLVFVKETGCGLSWQDGEILKRAGVGTVEVAGAGGTSWTGVEALRAADRDARIGERLWDWGIPTAVSTAWMVDSGFDVIASGGIRDGLNAARALAMGARAVAVAAPLVAARETAGLAGMRDLLEDILAGLRYVMLACGAADLAALEKVPRVLGPDLTRWIETGWQGR